MKKRLLSMALCIVMALGLMPMALASDVSVEAEQIFASDSVEGAELKTSKKNNSRLAAKEAYRKLLSGYSFSYGNVTFKTADCEFALVYLDNDSIPELFVSNGHWGVVFSYKNGKVKNVSQYLLLYPNEIYYYKKQVFFASYTSQHGNGKNMYDYCLYKNGKVTEKLYRSTDMETGKTSYSVYSKHKWKSISSTKYHKLLKKYSGGKKRSRAEFHTNTQAMRNKYLA